MNRSLILAAALIGVAQLGFAAGPASSLRPEARPAQDSQPPVQSPAVSSSEPQGSRGLFASLRPLFRSNRVAAEGRAAQRLRAAGAVCGDLAIQGEIVGRVTGRLPGCVIEDAVRIREAAGVSLSMSAVMDCTTASALKTWLETSAKPVLARKGGGLSEIRIAAHYACRTRNNQKGARLSEHGKGRAIDISGFRFRDGTEISLLTGWNARGFAQAMRQMHKGACGPFGTVLGPEANRFHRDHFHFDTARYRSGPFCR